MSKDISKEHLKNINVEISNECWKKIKILSIQKETTFQELAREILEKSVQTKKYELVQPETNAVSI